MESTRIIIADDHPLVRSALRSVLAQTLSSVNIAEADTIASMQKHLQDKSPDLIMLDLNMPGAHGFSALLYLRGRYPDIPVMVVSADENEVVIRKALGYGAAGFLSKSAPMAVIQQAACTILEGGRWVPEGIDTNKPWHDDTSEHAKRIATLTPQQFRVLGMIGEGMLNKQIAYDLGVSEATVKAHVTTIFKKLGVRSRTKAVIYLQQLQMEEHNQNTEPNGTDTPPILH